MEEKTVRCEVCGASNAKMVTKSRTISTPYGPTLPYTEFSVECPVCRESYATDEEPEDGITAALRESNSQAVVAILDYLNDNGITNSYLERALRLPARTTARWKRGEVSASALALLRCVRTYPWLLEVADANCNPLVAIASTLNAAIPFLPNARALFLDKDK